MRSPSVGETFGGSPLPTFAMKPRVIIGPAQLKAIPHTFEPILTAAGLDHVYPAKNVQMLEDDLLAQLPGCVAALAGSEPFTPRVLEAAAAKGLRVIARAGVGYDTVDCAAATSHGIAVCIAPGTNQDAVAEHTFTLILALLKNLTFQHNAIMSEKKWIRKATVPLRGSTLGLVGLGRIGKSVATRGLAFGCKVVAYEPYPDKTFVQQHGIELLPIDELLKRSDIVSLHLPSTAESRQMINKASLAKMKPTAYLVNTARGSLVNEPDLYEALKSGKLAGAGLDVFDEEPPQPDNPLLTLPNVVATAHTAGIDTLATAEMARVAATAIARLLSGDWPEGWVVNPEVKEAFFRRRV